MSYLWKPAYFLNFRLSLTAADKNPRFLALLKRVWKNDKLKEVLVEEGKISTENTICLLTGSPHNIEERLKTALAEKHFSKNELIVFVVGISSAHGGEVKTANILDCLYRKKGEVLNFSRSETFSLGTSFTDLKLLLEVIQPHLTITIQNKQKTLKIKNLQLESAAIAPTVN
ncbi:5186_t:CDS:2 [Entrophospora sp. SA101]|nr:5186_t:CDS:2 [Entrophospora sp. SA101]